MADPLIAVGLTKLFFDTVEKGPKGAAKGVASLAAGPAGTAYDVYDMARKKGRRQGLGKQMAGLLVDPKKGR